MITLESLTKVFETAGEPVTAVDHVTMEVPQGETAILLGPSGCGKTTTLKMINRIIPKTSGKIFINGEDTDKIDKIELRRNIGYVIQQIGLFPNMTVEENVSVVPDLLGWDRKRTRARAAELLEMVALDPAIFLKRYPKELSGGQQQRVGVARALAADPPVMLMDEPFGAVDPINREIIQDEFLRLQKQMRKTILFVSHDIDEAVKMGDRVAIFREGKLIQYDTPDNVLAHPANDFIADFVGTDRTLKRLRLVRVYEAMDHDPPKIRPEDDIREAVRVMEKREHQNAVVVGPRGRPRGYVHFNDVKDASGRVNEHWAGYPRTVHINADLRTAVSEMFAHNVTWLACVDDDGRFRGYITLRQITHHLGATYSDASEIPDPNVPPPGTELIVEREAG
ncbi:ABC transporter ATP-binding protein [Dichotomicrobium thermohalophilum]|uniref:Quaternary amine transport ATP-binding protein n=1 Tax=Dichotomicrobium thermohalophilum TaxID=933063 RepID=A0A397QF07_9HYPH|nr:ABC transporter ATP-binding protein [Dichotomicrobium thermohalophilum]RIA56871.1 osmoprotectant transport system ATP-binding protein [Dichotomicrobium thermohalophilum]